jgi:1-deoxy-D-xylulose-5-phosphate reductoisomerase
VAAKHNIKVKALAANSDVEKLAAQAKELLPERVCIYREDKKAELEKLLSGTGIKISTGMEGLKEIARMDGVDIMLNSVVGMVGLVPTLTAIEKGTDIALANKETLVAGGELVIKAAAEKGVKIYPVDSEHSAIFQCLQGNEGNKLKGIILTASGGPFFGKTKSDLEGVTVEQALNHPNWSMGRKITIDSATLMDNYLDLLRSELEKPHCFDKFKPLVHKRCAVCCYLLSHVPVRVLQCLCLCYCFQLFVAVSEKRTARCRKNQLIDRFWIFAHKTLEYR